MYTIMKELQRETDKRRTPWTDALVVYTKCKNDDKNWAVMINSGRKVHLVTLQHKTIRLEHNPSTYCTYCMEEKHRLTVKIKNKKCETCKIINLYNAIKPIHRTYPNCLDLIFFWDNVQVRMSVPIGLYSDSQNYTEVAKNMDLNIVGTTSERTSKNL